MNTISHHRWIHPDDRPLLILAFIKIIILCWTNFFDGIFIDELYYIACSKHLDFGYVDHPPMVALIAAATRMLLGDSLFALRLPAVLTGALIVYLTGRFARELGGGRYAQFLAALAALACPLFMGISSYYSMNVFDQLFWLLGAYLLVLIGKNEKPLYWILLGVVLGVGLQNKISVLFFGFGLFAGMILTQNRRWFLSRWIWISGAIAGLIFLPHILWQIAYGWPTLEFIHNATLYKNLPMTPVQFIMNIILDQHPFLFPLWLLGLIWYLFLPGGKSYRMFGWTFFAVLFVLMSGNGKAYYLGPIFTILFAAGAVALESFIVWRNWMWMKPTITVIVIISGLMSLPFALPILPTKTYIRYANAMGVQPSTGEKKEIGPLPQFFADRYGWEEIAGAVADVYNRLSPEEKTQCVIIGSGYGYAGAIDYFGAKWGLPNALSPQNSYHLWGPGDKPGEIAIIFGISKKDIEKVYTDIQEAAIYDNPYIMPYRRHTSIYVCRHPKCTLQEAWPKTKHYI